MNDTTSMIGWGGKSKKIGGTNKNKNKNTGDVLPKLSSFPTKAQVINLVKKTDSKESFNLILANIDKGNFNGYLQGLKNFKDKELNDNKFKERKLQIIDYYDALSADNFFDTNKSGDKISVFKLDKLKEKVKEEKENKQKGNDETEKDKKQESINKKKAEQKAEQDKITKAKEAQKVKRDKEEAIRKTELRSTNTRFIIVDYIKIISTVNNLSKGDNYTKLDRTDILDSMMQLGLPTGYVFSNLKFDNDLEKQNELFNKYVLSARNFIAKRLISKQDDIKSFNNDIKELTIAYNNIKDYKPVTPEDLKEIMENKKIISDKTKEEKLRNELQKLKTDTEKQISGETATYEQNRKNYLDNQEKELKLRNDMEKIQDQKKLKEIEAIEKDSQDRLQDRLDRIKEPIQESIQPVQEQQPVQEPIQKPVQPAQEQPVQQPMQEQQLVSVEEKIEEKRKELKIDIDKELELKKKLERDEIMLLKKEQELNNKIKEQELKERERLIELELVERKIKDKKIELKDKLSADIEFNIIPNKKDFQNTVDYLNKLKLKYIIDSDKTTNKNRIVIKIAKYLKMIKTKPLHKIVIKNKGKPINDVLQKIIKIDIKHRKNLIKIIANKNIGNKHIINHLSDLSIDILNHYHDFIVLLINNPIHRDKSLSILIK